VTSREDEDEANIETQIVNNSIAYY
jgi:hypothetical protein